MLPKPHLVIAAIVLSFTIFLAVPPSDVANAQEDQTLEPTATSEPIGVRQLNEPIYAERRAICAEEIGELVGYEVECKILNEGYGSCPPGQIYATTGSDPIFGGRIGSSQLTEVEGLPTINDYLGGWKVSGHCADFRYDDEPCIDGTKPGLWNLAPICYLGPAPFDCDHFPGSLIDMMDITYPYCVRQAGYQEPTPTPEPTAMPTPTPVPTATPTAIPTSTPQPTPNPTVANVGPVEDEQALDSGQPSGPADGSSTTSTALVGGIATICVAVLGAGFAVRRRDSAA